MTFNDSLIEKLLIRAGTADCWKNDTIVIPADEVEYVVRQHQAEPVRASGQDSGKPFLSNFADGVDGHYCISRSKPEGYAEHWNNGRWCSAGEVFALEGSSASMKASNAAVSGHVAHESPASIDFNIQREKIQSRVEVAIKYNLDQCEYYKGKPNARSLAYDAVKVMDAEGEGQLLSRDAALRAISACLRSGKDADSEMQNSAIRNAYNRVRFLTPYLPKPASGDCGEMRYNEPTIVSDLRDYEKYLRGEVVKSEGLASEVYFRGRADGVNDCIAKLRAMEPVVVDLGKCAEGVMLRAKRIGIKLATPHGGSRENAWQFAKAVLDAAGVKYHED